MRPRTAATLGSMAVAGVALAAFLWPAAPPPDHSFEASTLTIGTEVERSLAGGERHLYRVGLKAGHALHVVVNQRNVDVAVSVFDPQGDNLLTVDGPNGPDGPESLAVVATAEGEHRLEVAAAPAPAGGYQLQVETLGPAGELDRARAAGMKLYARAEQRRRAQEAVALVAYDKALEQWRQLGNQTMEAAVLHNLGVHYVSLGRLEEGFEFLHSALAVRRETGDRRGQAVTLTAVGWTSGLQGEYEAALTAYDEALSLRRSVGDQQGEAVTLDQRGTVYHRMGRHEEALDCYRQALPLAQGNRLSAAHIRVNLGAVHLAMRQPEAAIDPLRWALQIFRETGALNGQAAALTAIARVERQLGRLAAARQHLEAALEIVESVRARLQSRWLRSSFLAVRHDDYGAYIDLLMQMEADEPGRGHAVRAFEVSERARARTLLESLAQARAGVREAAAPELLECERALRAQINAKERRRIAVLAEGSTAEVAALDRELRLLLLEYTSDGGREGAAGPRQAGAAGSRPADRGSHPGGGLQWLRARK